MTCAGVGLFEGIPVRLVLKPAPADHGVVFVRTDLQGTPQVRASIDNVAEDVRRTSLVAHGVRVSTVEHLLAALNGMNVDHLLVLIDAPEVPVMDGSALVFVRLLQDAGFVEQTAERRTWGPDRTVRVSANDAGIKLTPSASGELRISYELCYPDERFGPQNVSFTIDPLTFAAQIAPARSFCLEEEVDALVSRGLGKGADPDNTVVIGSSGSWTRPLRFSDEPARHKVLDLLGDLFLLGADLDGHVRASRSGHPLNHRLTKELSARMENTSGRSMEPLLDVDQIRKILPHRYPFLLVDRVLELEPGKRALGYKNVTANENFFVGHFPEKPLMPGVLQLEAMAQLGGILMLQQIKSNGRLAVLLSMDGVKFRRAVVPGDRLMLEALALKIKSRSGQVKCTASVEGQVAAEATITFMLVDFNEPKSNGPNSDDTK